MLLSTCIAQLSKNRNCKKFTKGNFGYLNFYLSKKLINYCYQSWNKKKDLFKHKNNLKFFSLVSFFFFFFFFLFLDHFIISNFLLFTNCCSSQNQVFYFSFSHSFLLSPFSFIFSFCLFANVVHLFLEIWVIKNFENKDAFDLWSIIHFLFRILNVILAYRLAQASSSTSRL